MANQAAVSTILQRIKQLKDQQSKLIQETLAAEVVRDGSADTISRLIKEGKSDQAQAVSVQRQQPAQKTVENNLQTLVATDRNIAQLNAQVARLTGVIPPDFANEIGANATASLQQLLARDPAAFDRATVEIFTGAAVRTAESIRKEFDTVDFGDEQLNVIPGIPSSVAFVVSPAGLSRAETLSNNAAQQYQQFITEEATRVIPKYANSASPPPVAVSTVQPGATGGAALNRVQNSTPAPQTNIDGRDIAIATGLAVAGSAALAFFNNRGNVIPTDTPGLPSASVPAITPSIVPQQPVTAADPQSDPRTAGENVGSVLEAPPVGLTESEVIGDFSADPRIAGENVVSDAAIAQAAVDNARNQQSIREQRGNNVDSADWRVRLRLAPAADYLYKAANPGILQPLAVSDGVIFPYTPSIQTAYKANYNSYNLTHSNYRGFFYQGSSIEDITITGVFTAQDSTEAAYLLAVIHFFRSATKMFYGQDGNRGAPPPLVYLSALGESQYVDAPCVIGQFNYNLPTDVDYIRAGAPNQDGTNLLKRRDRQYLPTNRFSSALQRLQNARTGGLPRGGQVLPPPPPTLGLSRPTYVPTRMEISIVLHPMQSRQQVSQQFSLKEYSSGKLQPRGFW